MVLRILDQHEVRERIRRRRQRTQRKVGPDVAVHDQEWRVAEQRQRGEQAAAGAERLGALLAVTDREPERRAVAERLADALALPGEVDDDVAHAEIHEARRGGTRSAGARRLRAAASAASRSAGACARRARRRGSSPSTRMASASTRGARECRHDLPPQVRVELGELRLRRGDLAACSRARAAGRRGSRTCRRDATVARRCRAP